MWLFDILLKVWNIEKHNRQIKISVNKTKPSITEEAVCLFVKAVGWWLLVHYVCNLHNFVKHFGLRKCYEGDRITTMVKIYYKSETLIVLSSVNKQNKIMKKLSVCLLRLWADESKSVDLDSLFLSSTLLEKKSNCL